MKTCDLHTHSIYSDGTFTPKQILDQAIEIGLSSVVLSDHNTVDGLSEFLEYANDKNINAIAGCEFSVDYDGKELHLLGLFIDEKYFGEISELMEEFNRRKEESNVQLIEALNKDGYKIDFDTIKNSTPNGKFNRAHVAAELVRCGYVENREQAFKTLLSKKGKYYKEPKRITFYEMLDYLTSIGATGVLAHPFLNLNEEELEICLFEASKRGLVGMEVFYSLYDEEKTKKSMELADKYHLKYSGGSDFHGENKPDIQLGIGKGNLVIPNDWAENLKGA